MSGWWINEWRTALGDLSVVNVTVSRHDLIVVALGFGFGVRW